MSRSGAALAAMTAAVIVSACDAGVSVGGACVRSGECTAPLACVLGRCREECVVQRDCPLGGLCVEQASGLRGCIPPDEECGDFCASPLVCRDDRCSNECSSDAECFGGTCSAGACRAAEPVDGGALVDAPTSDAAPHDGGTSVQGTPCTTSSECAGNATCADARCLVHCEVATGAGCPSGARCSEEGLDFPPDYHAGLPAGTGLCTDLCNPVDRSGCPETLSCDVVAAVGGVFYTYCRRNGSRALGEPCTFTGQCSADLICEIVHGTDAGAGARTCLAFCDPDTDTCPSGWTCGMSARTESDIDFALCDTAT
jgi:hypothetical protein